MNCDGSGLPQILLLLEICPQVYLHCKFVKVDDDKLREQLVELVVVKICRLSFKQIKSFFI